MASRWGFEALAVELARRIHLSSFHYLGRPVVLSRVRRMENWGGPNQAAEELRRVLTNCRGGRGVF